VAYLDRKICAEVAALTSDHRHHAGSDGPHRLRSHRHMGQYGNEHANGDCRSQRICPNDRFLFPAGSVKGATGAKRKTNRRLRSWPAKVENRLTTVLSTSSDIEQNIVGHTICCQTGSSKVKNRVEPEFVRSELRTNFHDNSFRRRTCRLPANGSDRNRGLRFA
jgi:hypothetical protein